MSPSELPLPAPPCRDRTTTLAAFFDPEEGGARRPFARLVGEAAVYTGIGVFLTQTLDVDQPGVLSIFLASGALGSRAKEILRRSEDDDGSPALLDLFALFLGTMLAYAVTAWVLGPLGTERAFGFALEAAGARQDSLLDRSFPDAVSLVGHNFAVLGAVVVLSLVYRTYGALLALTWNAAVWGVVLASLVGRALEAQFLAAAAVALGVLPHLGLEAWAYVAGALAGARVGRRLTLQAEFRIPFRPFRIAALALVAAAVLEATVPEWVADRVVATAASEVRS